jgi:small GTP-binding protein
MSTVVKAVLVGDSAVGKTSIYQRLEHNIFNVAQMPTVGGSFARITIRSESGPQEIGLWDTAGQERFRTIVPLYFQRASLVLIVFNIASRDSYDNVQTWYELAKSHAPPEVRYFLIGNKADLIDERAVPFDDAQTKSEQLHADVYIETSAVTGAGCEDLLAAFGRYIGNRSTEGSELPIPKLEANPSLGSGSARTEPDRQTCC